MGFKRFNILTCSEPEKATHMLIKRSRYFDSMSKKLEMLQCIFHILTTSSLGGQVNIFSCFSPAVYFTTKTVKVINLNISIYSVCCVYSGSDES